MKRILCPLNFVTLLIISLACGGLQADGEIRTPATLDELKTAIAAVIGENGVPAVGIAMVDENGPVWIGAIGKANLEQGIDADGNTLFRIGSTSKMFVALAVLKLVEQGRLSLDDRVADLAPEIGFENPWEDSDPVRVVHLLEHTTGWDDIHLPEYAHNDPAPATLKEGLDFHPHSRISRWKPGTRMSYCNSGPPVAAYIVEKLTGQGFEDYAEEHFFEPIGMETASYFLSEDVVSDGATLYANGNEPQEYWHILMRPSGSINASPTDMAKFVRFYLDRGRAGGRQLVSRASLERMETTESTSGAMAGQETGYGLHNYTSAHEQWVYREHNGGVNGGITEFAYLPEAKLGHAIMINSDDGASFRKISRLVRAYETRALGEKSITGDREVSAANRLIEGYYIPINPRQQLAFFLERIFNVQKLWFEQGKLARKALLDDKISHYFPVSDDLYKSSDTGLISLSRTTDPIAGDVVHAGMLVLKPVSALQVYGQLGIAVAWGLIIATSIVFFPVWLIRRVRGKIPPGGPVPVRSWPLLAAFSVVAVTGLFMLGMRDPFGILGAPTAVSIGIAVLTVAYAVFSILGVLSYIRHRKTAMNRAARWHSGLASVLHLVVAVYLMLFGVIGLVTWA
jgi:CubicO group peptidase (beta-lactamase class C family)